MLKIDFFGKTSHIVEMDFATLQKSQNDPNRLFDLDLYRTRLEKCQNNLGNYDFLLKEAGDNLCDRLLDIKREFKTVLELGHRHNGLFETIKNKSETYIRSSIIEANENKDCLYHPEFLPYKDKSFDLVISNLHAHHINDLPGFLIQAKRLLKKDGLLLMSLFGVETLNELRSSLTKISANEFGNISPRLSPLVDIRDAGGLLQRAGFNLPVTDKEVLTVTYANAFQLLVDLRGMGETNPLFNQNKKTPPKDFFPKVCTDYAHNFSNDEGRIKASFEIIYLTAWRPDESQQQPLKPGSAKATLSDALKTTEIELDK